MPKLHGHIFHARCITLSSMNGRKSHMRQYPWSSDDGVLRDNALTIFSCRGRQIFVNQKGERNWGRRNIIQSIRAKRTFWHMDTNYLHRVVKLQHVANNDHHCNKRYIAVQLICVFILLLWCRNTLLPSFHIILHRCKTASFSLMNRTLEARTRNVGR